MGTGIGKYCKICDRQLCYDEGFNYKETLCDRCETLIPKFIKYLAERIKNEPI